MNKHLESLLSILDGRGRKQYTKKENAIALGICAVICVGTIVIGKVSGVSDDTQADDTSSVPPLAYTIATADTSGADIDTYDTASELYYDFGTEKESSAETETESALTELTLDDIPDYSGEPYTVVNENVPYFEIEDITTEVFEYYSPLDSLGRCGVCFVNICKELMPTEEREDISSVTPTGWVNNSYDFIGNGGWLYNRCHLIGFQLAGENDNEQNLITGTYYMNVEGMLPFENTVADYIDDNSENHVLYRATPLFDGDNLVCDGVLMEAYSVEDNGSGVEFCVFCYNVQDGVEIDYATGENTAA